MRLADLWLRARASIAFVRLLPAFVRTARRMLLPVMRGAWLTCAVQEQLAAAARARAASAPSLPAPVVPAPPPPSPVAAPVPQRPHRVYVDPFSNIVTVSFLDPPGGGLPLQFDLQRVRRAFLS